MSIISFTLVWFSIGLLCFLQKFYSILKSVYVKHITEYDVISRDVFQSFLLYLGLANLKCYIN